MQKRFPTGALAAAGLAVMLAACEDTPPAQAPPGTAVEAESPDSAVMVPGAAQPGPQFENE